MDSSLTRRALRILLVAAVAFLGFASRSGAQAVPNQTQMGLSSSTLADALHGNDVDAQAQRDQKAAYKAFLAQQEATKKIELGKDFVQRYPKSPLAERVDVGMMDIYRAQRDWKDSYLCADHALALQPDDVDVLATVGWTIPHVYSPDDPDADQELNKAETYAKHALDVMAKMPKPADLTDAQFEAAKARRTFQAHSALGLVYFRREDYANSAKELELSTKGNPVQDATDLFVMGVDLQNLNRYSEAEDAFTGCSQIVGPLQDRCKQSAVTAKAQATQAKSN
jgi:tetratricopeptide (TPR) repeat protein